jgi:X-Pro dipeptidyl-peptidase C-terminal non-catalytic domain
VASDQIARHREVTRRRRVPDRLIGITLCAVPCAGPPVQLGSQPGLGARQLLAQHIAEQLMVAEPLAPAVEADQEQVRPLNLLQPDDPVRPARHRVAGRAAQPLQDRGAQQELAQPPGLGGDELVEVLGDLPVIAGERGHERLPVALVLKRQRGQPQPGRPALGPLPQQRHLGRLEPEREGVVQQRPGLRLAEAKLRGADLQHLARGAHAAQRERRVRPGRDRQLHVRGKIVVGPWNHTSGFSKNMPIIAAEALAWLRAYLTGNGDAPGPAPVRVHVSETGGKGQWRDLADWPPPDAIAQSWHLDAGGTLAESPGEGTSSFRYDPHDPTPSVGGPRMGSNGFGSKNNGKLEARDDVLVFTGPVISEPQEVIGPVSLRLRVRGSSPDFDVFARLCDVDAKGTSWNMCDGLLRLDATAPADADGWTEIEVPMSATAHRFARGHRLRLQVSGGAHPRWARNTGTFEQIATATTLVPVDIEISHHETVLSLPVLRR